MMPYAKGAEAESKHQHAKFEIQSKTVEVEQASQLEEMGHIEREPQNFPKKSLGTNSECASYSGNHEVIEGPSHAMAQSAQSDLQDIISAKSSSLDISKIQASSILPDTSIRGNFPIQDTNDGKCRLVMDDKLRLNSEAVIQEGKNHTGVGFDELVDRLLSQATSKADVRFAAIFLCLYRQFCAPSTLLDAIIFRFECLNQNISHQTARVTAQLRHLNVVAQWITEYPDDFADSLTRDKITRLISALAGHRPFGMAIKELRNHLDAVCEDDEPARACSNTSKHGTNTKERFQDKPSTQSIASTAPIITEDGGLKRNPDKRASSTSKRDSATPSTSSNNGNPSSRSTATSQPMLSCVEGSQRQASLPTPNPRTNLCKAHWHFFMNLPDEDIAQELTRIDWALFSSIRSRDLVKRVGLCVEDKDKRGSLENISPMINQFNHVAFWITNIVLLRDKPKHRAKALEKCMAVAWVSKAFVKPLKPKKLTVYKETASLKQL